MKGSAEIEFILSTTVFIGTMIFIVFTVINQVPFLESQSNSQNLRSTSYQISELLLLDRGFPDNWESFLPAVGRIGLSSGSFYIVSDSKIAGLNSLCQQFGYQKLKSMFNNNDVLLSVTYSDDPANRVSGCLPPVQSLARPKFTTERTAVLDTTREIVHISVGILG